MFRFLQNSLQAVFSVFNLKLWDNFEKIFISSVKTRSIVSTGIFQHHLFPGRRPHFRSLVTWAQRGHTRTIARQWYQQCGAAVFSRDHPVYRDVGTDCLCSHLRLCVLRLDPERKHVTGCAADDNDRPLWYDLGWVLIVDVLYMCIMRY